MDFLWLYDLSEISFCLIVLAACLAFGVGGLLATRRWVESLHSPHPQNDVVSYYFAAVGIFYGITLGLLAVGTWQTYSDTETKAEQEAGALGALYRDVGSYPEPMKSLLRSDLKQYTRQLIDVGWPQQRMGIVPDGGVLAIDRFQDRFAAFNPVTEGQKVLHMSAMTTYNHMIELRRARLQATSAGLSRTLWTTIVVGSMLTLAAAWFFHTSSFAMHVWMTVILGTLLGMELFLLAVMDRPFRGAISVGPDAFELVYRQLMN